MKEILLIRNGENRRSRFINSGKWQNNIETVLFRIFSTRRYLVRYYAKSLIAGSITTNIHQVMILNQAKIQHRFLHFLALLEKP